MGAFSTVIVTKKAMAAGIATAAILGGGIAAEASGVTASLTGRTTADAHVSRSGTETALETLATVDARANAEGGLQTARDAIAAAQARKDARIDTQARVNAGAEGQHDASVGAQVSVQAQSRLGAMKEFVLNLLGVQTGGNAHVSASVGGTEAALDAVTNAGAAPAAEFGISTAVNAIGGGQADLSGASGTNVHAAAGLSTALDAVTTQGAEASAGVSADSNLTAQTTLDGIGAGLSGSAGLRLGMSRTR